MVTLCTRDVLHSREVWQARVIANNKLSFVHPYHPYVDIYPKILHASFTFYQYLCEDYILLQFVSLIDKYCTVL